MANEAACNAKRQQILRVAKQLADDGAHYLWGAEGQRPGRSAPGLFAPVVVNGATPGETTFCAATLTVDKIVYVCAGRCSHSGLASVKPVPKLIATPESDGNLKAFISKYQGNPNAQYGWGLDLTPRKVRGDKIVDYNTNKDITDQVVWGEGCDDTQHFDCGGFVRYVVRQACGVNIAGISQGDPAKRKNSLGQPMGRLLDVGETVLPADILVYSGHIAFATGDPPLGYHTNIYYKLAQAESAVYGVNYGKTHKAANQKCIRLSDSTLLNSP